MYRLLLPVSLFLLATPLAAAQTAETAPPAYTPTSRRRTRPAPDAGWPSRFPERHLGDQLLPVFESSPMLKTLVVSEAESKTFVDTMVNGIMSNPAFSIDPEGHVIIGGTDGLPLVRGERRSRLVVLPLDGKVPLTPEAK